MSIRATMINTLQEIAQEDKNSYFVFVDGTETIFAETFKETIEPERLINLGISEQNAVSFASGLAMQGRNVYLFGCSFFIGSRAFEQIKTDLAYNNANVTIWGGKSGIKAFCHGGYSHWGIEDIALISTLPNIQIANVATEEDLKYYYRKSIKHNGPIFIVEEDANFPAPKNYVVDETGISTIQKGNDFEIFACGNALNRAKEFADKIRDYGFSASIQNVHSLRPLNEKFIQKIIDKKRPIMVIDEHTQGGLVSIISNVISKYGKPVKFIPLCINQDKCNTSGRYDYVSNVLMKYDETFENLLKSLIKKRGLLNIILPIKVTKKRTGTRIMYSLFGILPLLKLKTRTRIKNNRPPYRYYLFGFIRIL